MLTEAAVKDVVHPTWVQRGRVMESPQNREDSASGTTDIPTPLYREQLRLVLFGFPFEHLMISAIEASALYFDPRTKDVVARYG